MDSHPNVSTSGPAYDPTVTGPYYYESYVAQDPSWNLEASGWTSDPGQATGAAEMLVGSYNLPVQTRVWNQDAATPSWGPWISTLPDASSSPNPSQMTAPSSNGSFGAAEAAGLFAIGLGIAVFAWLR
jgi:hypothetical protein